MRCGAVRTAWAGALAGALALAGLPGQGALAQDVGVVQSEILTLDPDRLFAQTQAGQRLTEQYKAERDRLIADNRELEAQLREEEEALTEARKDMKPEEFRDKADAFDDKVRSIRKQSERQARELERGREIAPRTLMRLAEPVLVQLMRDTGGKIILDNRHVLLRADAIDITDLAVSRVDAAIGDGSDLKLGEGAPAPPEDSSSQPREDVGGEILPPALTRGEAGGDAPPKEASDAAE